MKRKDLNKYPKGWTATQIRALAHYYDNQSEDEGAAEIEGGFRRETDAIIIVPKKLLPAIRQLIARNKKRAG